MEMYQDGVCVNVTVNEAACRADEERRNPLDLEECPLGEGFCDPNCFYYTED